jgi:hypothetical protein
MKILSDALIIDTKIGVIIQKMHLLEHIKIIVLVHSASAPTTGTHAVYELF